MTKNIVIAEVAQVESAPVANKAERLLSQVKTEKQDFIFRFDLVAPSMGSYRFNLFTIIYPITFYPMKIYI